MTTSLSIESKRNRATGKTASTRLLDLLAGWADFVATDEENRLLDSSLAAETIADLYQLAGSLSESWEKLSPEDENAAVLLFLEERVLPLVLGHER